MTAPTHLCRSVLGSLVVALMAVLSLLAAGPSAQAHTDLIRSSPAEGDRLETAPTELELEFSEDVDPDLATVVLSRAGNDPVRLEVVGGDQATLLLAAVPAEAPSATEAWSVGYRVTSVDGHPIEGSVEFVVAGSGPTASSDDGVAPEKSDPGATEGAADTRALGTGRFPWRYAAPVSLVAALVMLGTVLTVARIAGRAGATSPASMRDDDAP